MLDIYDELWHVVKDEWGIDLTIETRAEGRLSAFSVKTHAQYANVITALCICNSVLAWQLQLS
jgi:hypothetical protein